jgi:hypothetical protein
MNELAAPELPRESTRHRGRVSGQNGDLSQRALRLVEDAELPQHRPPVVIDFFPGEAIIGVEGVNPAERELESPPGRRKATPAAKMGTADDDFNQNRVVGDMPVLSSISRSGSAFISCS